jgi:hypothetical protein
MVNKIKAIFATIGSIGAIMFASSALFWVFTQWPAQVLEFFIVMGFAYWGYEAYKFFLKRFQKQEDNKQINS